jgi:hypothetical protein
MVGVNGAEVIHEAAMGLRFHATIDDMSTLTLAVMAPASKSAIRA